MKALGTGWGQGLGFPDVEVERDGDAAPRLVSTVRPRGWAALLGFVPLSSLGHAHAHHSSDRVGAVRSAPSGTS
jgi:hypothetical protein